MSYPRNNMYFVWRPPRSAGCSGPRPMVDPAGRDRDHTLLIVRGPKRDKQGVSRRLLITGRFIYRCGDVAGLGKSCGGELKEEREYFHWIFRLLSSSRLRHSAGCLKRSG